MGFKGILPLVTLSIFSFVGTVHASTLVVSVAGQFSSPVGNQTSQLWSANAKWALSFNVDSSPVVSNRTTLGFDLPFYQFAYSLNGSKVSASPAFIRFSTSSGLGLFTLFFGPESGYSNGVPIPEFAFEGPQAFSGTVSNPAFSVGTFAVSDWNYSDATNYDENTSPSSIVTVAPTPEPSTALLLCLPLFLLASGRVRRVFLPN